MNQHPHPIRTRTLPIKANEFILFSKANTLQDNAKMPITKSNIKDILIISLSIILLNNYLLIIQGYICYQVIEASYPLRHQDLFAVSN